MDVERALLENAAPGYGGSVGRDRCTGQIIGNRRTVVANGRHLEGAINETPHGRAIGLTQALRCSRNRIEHRLQLGGRARDDAKYLGSRGLVLKRHLELSFARLLSFEQPRVLDGNDGLVGEGVEEFNLLIGEGANL